MVKPKPIKILVVVVNYFSASLVTRLLQQLTEQALPSEVSISVICADNSCSPEQQNTLSSLLSEPSIDIDLIENSSNLGFGRAINDAIAGRHFDFLCCINPDVDLLPDCLFELIEHAQQHQAEGIWGGLTVDDQLQPDFRHAWQEPNLQNTLGWALGLRRLTPVAVWQDDYRHIKQPYDAAYPVDSVSGCFFMISAPAWDAVKGFDTTFFLYSEEIDLCRRARISGFQPTVVTQTRLQHAGHTAESSIHRIKLIYLSKFLYAAKHHGLLYNFLYRTLVSVGALIRAMRSLLRGQLELSKAWMSVVLSSLLTKRINAMPGVNT